MEPQTKIRPNCILNKQYSKSDYEKLLAQIKSDMKQRGEYGQFFPPSLSPHFFNHSAAMEFFPLDKSAAIKLGYIWIDEEITPITSDLPFAPDSIDALDEAAIKTAFRCTKTNKPYKILPEELKFLRRERLRPPSVAPLTRIETRSIMAQSYSLAETNCCICNKIITTTASDDMNNVACSDCITLK